MAGYNGWANYETWAVALWMSNDEANYDATRDIARECLAISTSGGAAGPLASAFREYVEELPEVLALTEGPATFVVDLFGAAMSDVDWYEIAENLLSEIAE